MRKIWEYTVRSCEESENQEAILLEHGLDGWELVSVVERPEVYAVENSDGTPVEDETVVETITTFYFKREYKTGEPVE